MYIWLPWVLGIKCGGGAGQGTFIPNPDYSSPFNH